jgi:hypothetical protein
MFGILFLFLHRRSQLRADMPGCPLFYSPIQQSLSAYDLHPTFTSARASVGCAHAHAWFVVLRTLCRACKARTCSRDAGASGKTKALSFCLTRAKASSHSSVSPCLCGEMPWKTKRPRNLSFPWPFGKFIFYWIKKKLIESPLSHGRNVPCRFQTALRNKEIHNAHEMNIVKLPEAVK